MGLSAGLAQRRKRSLFFDFLRLFSRRPSTLVSLTSVDGHMTFQIGKLCALLWLLALFLLHFCSSISDSETTELLNAWTETKMTIKLERGKMHARKKLKREKTATPPFLLFGRRLKKKKTLPLAHRAAFLLFPQSPCRHHSTIERVRTEQCEGEPDPSAF